MLCFLSGNVLAEKERNEVTLNFVNADIVSVIKAVGEITGKNFIIDPRVKGTINIVSSKPVSPDLTYPILLSALRLQGFAAVESKGAIKILPEADAKLNYNETIGTAIPSGGAVVTQVYAIRHQSAVQLVPVLRPLISPNNTIAAYPDSNALVITDYADNLRRIDHIIDAIDQAGGGPVIVPLRYASAPDAARAVNKLMSETGAPGATHDPSQGLTAVPDERTNSLILNSNNPSRIVLAQNLIAKLDVSTGDTGNVHVIYLRNSDATKLAGTLNSVISGESTASPTMPSLSFSPSSSTASSTTTPSSTASSTPSFSSASASSRTQTSGGSGMVQADEATNALIINAPEAIFNNLRQVVAKLDVRRAQIFVEALIVEVSVDKSSEFGIQWQDLTGANQTSAQLFGGTNFGTPAGGANIIGATTNIASVGQGLNLGIVKGQITIPGIAGPILNLSVLARALETRANANVLSTPNLMTLDNEEAKIVVGQNIPMITGSYAQTGTTTTTAPFQTYERKDVGLTLKIKPQISEGGAVQLQIYQEVSSVDAATLNNISGPTTTKRSIESTVLVDDGQIVVLGGLIQDSVSDGVSQVPLLGDLPVVGNLFRYKTRTHNKTNLMVFLRPHVLRNSDSYKGLTYDRYSYISDEQRKTQPSSTLMLPDVKSPVLPAIKPPDSSATH